jgi:hypothetical protein
MSYKNFLGRFGHRWFTDYDRKMVLIDFSADEYDVEVTFTDDKPDTPLKDCTGTETNVDAIMIYYKDGTGRRDPEPFRWQVTGVFHWGDFSTTVGDSNPRTYFWNRSKNRKLFPQTRNEPVTDIVAIRREVREKFVNFIHMNGIDDNSNKTGVLRVPVNCFNDDARKNLIRFLNTLEMDGIQTFLTIHFERSTIDQLTRLDTEMEFGDLAEVLEIAEERNHGNTDDSADYGN